MILRASLSPECFINTSQDSNISSLMVGILISLEKNCEILVDDQLIVPSITRILNSTQWPLTHRKKAKELLERIRHNKRIIRSPHVSNPSQTPCTSSDCRQIAALIENKNPDVLITPNKCHSFFLPHIKPSITELTSPTEYHFSKFHSNTQQIQQYSKAEGEVDIIWAENMIFSPIFRNAKHIKIIDRYIGRSICSLDPSVTPKLDQQYIDTLEWLCDIHQKSLIKNGKQDIGTFEIWCGVQKNHLSQKSIQDCAKLLSDWEKHMNNKGVKLKVHLKLEDHNNTMEHARYLITEQMGISIECGFALLLPDQKMSRFGKTPKKDPRLLRDFLITIVDIENIRRITSHLSRLTDISLQVS